MTSVVLRLDEPSELLALVPHLLGFQPRDSAVAVSLRGPRARVGLVARVDLADLADPHDGPQVARSLVVHLDRDGARRAVLVLYAEPGAGPVSRLHRAADHVREAFDVPFGGARVLVVGGGRYGCLDCSDGCCAPGGNPLSDLAATRSGAHMVLAGSAVATDRAALGRVALASAEARRAVGRVRRRRAEARTRAAERGPAAVARWRADALAAWRELVATCPDTPVPGGGSAPGGRASAGRPPSRVALLGRLEAGLDDRRVRDAVLVAMLPGTDRLPERALASGGPGEDAEVRAAVGRLVDPGQGAAPGDDVRAAEVVLEAVLAHGRRGRQAPTTTLLATVAWWRGDGARAAVLLERALRDDPDYRLAHLVRSAVAAGLAPGWAARGAS